MSPGGGGRRPGTADPGAGGAFSRRGFTMKEVLIVLVIIVICASVAIQGYRSFHNNRAAASAASKMQRALQVARTYAMAHSTSHRVTIDLRTGLFWVDRTGTLPSEEVSPTPNTQTMVDPILGTTVQIGQGKVVHPEKLPVDVIIAEMRDVESFTDPTFDLRFIIYRADGSCRTNAALQFVNGNDDLADPANYHTIQVYAPSGAIQYFPNQRR